jgi:transcriptional regulator with XRE-family HTH domain
MTTTDADSLRVQAFLRALGNELRKVRKDRGWTRQQLLPQLPFKISSQTLATWELATRHITVGRLLELTEALGVHLFDVLTPALAALTDGSAEAITLDLDQVARTRAALLQPLSRWARERLAADPYRRPNVVVIGPDALPWLAVLCQSTTLDLAQQLQRFAAKQSIT